MTSLMAQYTGDSEEVVLCSYARTSRRCSTTIPVGLLHPPADRLRNEALPVGVALDDVHLDAHWQPVRPWQRITPTISRIR